MSGEVLAKGGRERFDQQGFLLREDSAQIENQAVVFDSSDHRYSRGRSPEALLELRGGMACTGNTNDLRGKRLRRRRTATGQRFAIGNFQLDLAERHFRRKFPQKILTTALDFCCA